jgi:hypothetical protein
MLLKKVVSYTSGYVLGVISSIAGVPDDVRYVPPEQGRHTADDWACNVAE